MNTLVAQIHLSTFGEVGGLEEEGVERQKGKAVAPWSPWVVAELPQTAEPSGAAVLLMEEGPEEEVGQTDPAAG